MRLSSRSLCLPATLALTAGCSDPEACTAEAPRAIVVEPRDAVTEEFIAVAARGVVRDGAYAAVEVPTDGCHVHTALLTPKLEPAP